MKFSWLTIRDLEYLVALGKYLHFAKAAQSLFVTQPALSTQIKRIENHLGVLLFERHNRRVLVTERGQKVIEHAEFLLGQVQKLETISQATEIPFSEPFRVGAIATLGPYYIPRILPLLRRKYPKGKFIFREGKTEGLLEELEKGLLDVVLLALPVSIAATLQSTELFFEPFLLAFSKTMHGEGAKKIDWKKLNPRQMILLEDGHCLKDHVLEQCQWGKREQNNFQATSIETLKHLIAVDSGYTFLPLLTFRKEDSLNKLISVQLVDPKLGRKIAIAERKNGYRVKEVQLFKTLLKENIPPEITA